ncbi:hypothetical protein Pmani_032509 [Petrolisthes manimaculis]|nr:hypothetical protein Pmani_032509 [Petrolisthes manimaculis]
MATRNSAFIASGVFCLVLSLVYIAEVYFAYVGLVSRPPSFPTTTTIPEQNPAAAGYPTYPTNTPPQTYPPIQSSSYLNPSPSSVFSPPTTTTATTATTAATATAAEVEVAVDTVDTSQTDHNKSIYNTNVQPYF